MQRTRDLIPLAAARQLSLTLLALSAPAAALPLSVAQTPAHPAPASAAASPTPASLGLRSFDETCRIVREQFFDPAFGGLDWDGLCATRREHARDLAQDELAALLNTMLARLKTSHTAVYTPREPTWYLLFDVFAKSPRLRAHTRRYFPSGQVRLEGIGIFTRRIDGRVFIEAVLQGAPAAGAGLLVGDEILAVDGAPFRPVGSFKGKAGRAVSVRLRRRAGAAPVSLTVTPERLNPGAMFARAMEASARILERAARDRRIGYARVWSSAGPVYADLLRALIEAGPLSRAEALIIDLRGRIGGGGPAYLDILDPRAPRLTMTGRDFVQTSPASFRRRTVWLIDGGTRSGAELLAYTIKHRDYGPLVGAHTAGAVTGGAPFLLPNGSLLYVAVADIAIEGRRLEGVGVAPDIAVPFSLPYAAGADPQLERAIKEAQRLLP